MASSSISGFRARRDFGDRLRGLRGRATAANVGRQVNLSVSQLTRIENGLRNCKPEVLDRLIKHYELSDQEAAELRELAQHVWDASPPWWEEYGDVVTTNYAAVIEREADATRRRDYHPVTIPAHLQAAGYSRAVTAVGFYSLGPDQVDDLVAVRARRQQRLYEPPLLTLEAVVTEAALRFEVGGPEVHREQLVHLLRLTELDHVSLRVISFRAGAAGTQASAFNILSYEDPQNPQATPEPEVAFVHSLSGSQMKSDPRDLRRLNRLHDSLLGDALSQEDSRGLIANIERGLD
ncbi:helix-turn-helix domain-containing protein [Embleya sp. NBC_00888]|uniref:helix-turn-helix domain-containing protein n=1 Tax=Embleya sp. NBC_00888 TaxID=2975960 RepID=UPI00386BE4BC|nr:helix-turn-helix domain-containing protein [Embleya sp. NBC_00888]